MALITQAGNNLVTQGGNVLIARAAALPPAVPNPLSMETLRMRIGLQANDATKDAEILLAFNLTVEAIEKEYDRKFLLQNQVEKFTHVSGGTVSLIRYPVASISKITATGGGAPSWHLEKETGLLHFDGHVHEHELVVEYEGGYDPIPSDLLLAILLSFDNVWAAQSGSGAAVAAGNIRSVRVGEISIGYDTGAAASSAAAQGAIGGLIPAAAASILENYRRLKA